MKKLIQFIRKQMLPLPAFANIAVGTHSGCITRTLAAAVSTRYMLVKNGASVNSVEPCNASDRPLGIATDSGAAGDVININLPGVSGQTQLLVAATTIIVGDILYAAANGRVQPLPNSAGMFYEIGIALSPANAGELVEAATHAPLRAINIAPFEGNTANDLGKLGAALEQRPDKIRLLTV